MKKMKTVASLAFLLNTLLFGSYYAVAKETLIRIDPIVFTFFVMMTLVPPGVCIVALSWRHMTRAAVKSGFVMGSCLCLGLFMLSIALKYNSATGTAFFPSLNALLAVFCMWIFLRHPIAKATWYAGIISVCGAVLLMINSSMGGVRGALIAFLGSLLCTFYVFLSDHEQRDPALYWPLFGVELLTMALWANLIALLFGDWQAVHIVFPNDVWSILYIGLGTTLLPTLISLLLQKYIAPVTVAFIYILEPILGAIIAHFYLHELLPLDGYLGGGLIVAGAIIHTWGTVERPANLAMLRQRISRSSEQISNSLIGTLLYPIICCGVGIFIIYRLGGFPPPVWRDFSVMMPHASALIQQGHSFDVFLLVAQSLSWLIAWISIVVLGGLASYRVVEMLFYPLRSTKTAIEPPQQREYVAHTPHSIRKKNSSLLVQRRRQNRRERLMGGETVVNTRKIQEQVGVTGFNDYRYIHIEPKLVDAESTSYSQKTKQRTETDALWLEEALKLSNMHSEWRKVARPRLVSFEEIDANAESIDRVHRGATDTQFEIVVPQESYDTEGNHWVYWDDHENIEMRER